MITATMRNWNVRRLALAAALLAGSASGAAAATSIERITSPAGLEFWLVREMSTPLVAIDFAFRGGASEDPAGKAGVAHLTEGLLDEGAGPLDANEFQEKLERHAIELSFSTGRDYFRGSLRTLAEHRDTAFELLRLALQEPRFEADAIQRVKAQVLAGLRRESTNPQAIASRSWWVTAFPDHPYGREVHGTLESVPRIEADDLRAYTKRVFARDNLKIGIVGDVDPAAAGRLVDTVFASLPERAQLAVVPQVVPQALGKVIRIDLDVPQTVIQFGGPGIFRNDPDFLAAALVNHVLSGGSLTSRLYREVREKRGLVYGIHTALHPFEHTAVLSGGTATRADRTEETLAVTEREIARLAAEGPSDEELAKAKSYLKGAYALNFDTSSKIAGQLVQLQIDGLGADYAERRIGLIDAVTSADARRVAKRILAGPLLVTIVGRPIELASKPGGIERVGPVPAPAIGHDAGSPVSLH